MIPEAAVEAAAKALREAVHPTQAAIIGPYVSSETQARAALEAAAPHMLVENAAYRRGWCEGWRVRYRAQMEAMARSEQKKAPK